MDLRSVLSQYQIAASTVIWYQNPFLLVSDGKGGATLYVLHTDEQHNVYDIPAEVLACIKAYR